MNGFQSPLNGIDYKFRAVTGQFVQILNVNKGSHWLTVSNVLCEPNCVNVYDSAYSTIHEDTQSQICSFVRPNSDTLTINMPNFQRQPNGRDCGIFAIAVATELANGRDPSFCYWDVARMRPHLIESLEGGRIEPFPQKTHRRVPLGNKLKKTISVKIYCVCRMTNFPKKAMVKCAQCRQWFHNGCMGLDEDEVEDTWYCNSCQNILV